MPRRSCQDKQQRLYLVTALVQIVTRKQPATIIHPQPPSGGPARRARQDEAMAVAPAPRLSGSAWLQPSRPPWAGPAQHTGLRPSAERNRHSGVRTHCTAWNLNGWHGIWPQLYPLQRRECSLPRAVYEYLLEPREPSEYEPVSGIMLFMIVWVTCPAPAYMCKSLYGCQSLCHSSRLPHSCQSLAWTLPKLAILSCTQFSAKVLFERIQFSQKGNIYTTIRADLMIKWPPYSHKLNPRWKLYSEGHSNLILWAWTVHRRLELACPPLLTT